MTDANLTRAQRDFKLTVKKYLEPGMTSRELREHILYLCTQSDYNPIAALIGLAVDEDIIDPELQFKIHKEIAQYVMPKLRSLEVSGEVTQDIQVTVKKYDPITQEPVADPVSQAIEAEATEIGIDDNDD